MITGRDIVIISSIDWNFLWQVHQEIALRFAQAGNRVFYIENTGVRTPHWSDAGRILSRVGRWSKSLRGRGVGQVAANVSVISPLMLPPFSSLGRLANPFLFSLMVKRTLKRLGLRDPILWTYLPTDTAFEIIQDLRTPGSMVIYYCVADFSQLTSDRQRLQEVEQRLIEQSDLVFANSSQVAELCRQWSNDVHVFPPGVDFLKFAENGESPAAAPQSIGIAARPLPSSPNGSFLGSLPKPLIGYVGGLHRFVDYDLLADLARARPDWSWAFVGPIHTKIGELATLPNVFFLGQKQHDELAPLIRNFDVCLVPYLINASTVTIAPVKINEYLAVGKPIVSTELPTVCEFNRQHEVLFIAPHGSQSFLTAIEEALQEPKDLRTIARRQQVAALGDWQNRFNAMNDLIEHKMVIKDSRPQSFAAKN
ncbi:MAG TPA: glycosyltransferase [Pyrinomonadaceae bacterium]|nr:glycosyltransferase [Pyrinomonadaceae bacterium]